VSFDPYVSHVVTTSASTLGAHTLFVTSTTVWSVSGDSVPASALGPGIPLSEFADQVESALGPSQGALAMISLASPGGSINLEQAAVAGAAPAGEGTVDGNHVTYYDVTIDMSQLADTPDLSDQQRTTIAAAVPLLHQGGYTGTSERIGVDDAGYVREVDAENHFSDGSTGFRHTVLSNFGCAAKQYAPGEPVPAVTSTVPCEPVPATAPTSAPASTTAPSTSSNTAAPTSTAPTTTRATATTGAPTSTSAPATTARP
jgi:hypothetical protein